MSEIKFFLNKRKSYYKYLLFIFVSFIFLSVFSNSTSPLFNTYGNDSAVFMMLGKLFVAGKTPYVDFFDHKGPVIILIEALGISIFPDIRTGIFILQIINLTFIQLLIYRCANLFVSNLYSFSVVFLSLLMFSFTIQEGNLTEEYSLLFLYLSLFYTLIYFLSVEPSINRLHIFIIGVSAGILFWLRLNNLASLLACIIGMLVFSVKYKDRQGIKNLVLYFFIGFNLVSLFIILYFINLGAFNDMIYGTFIFNFKYIHLTGIEPAQSFMEMVQYVIKAWGAFIVLLIGTYFYYRKYKTKRIMFLTSLLFIISWLATHLGPQYPHYMTLNLPCFTLGAILLFKSIFSVQQQKNNIFICSICVFLLLGYMIGKYCSLSINKTYDDSRYIGQIKKMVSFIPEQDYNSVYIYSRRARFWLITGFTPSYKYFTKQEWHGYHDKKIIQKVNEMMDKSSPKWLFVEESQYSTNEMFWEIIKEKYILKDKIADIELYSLKEHYK